MNDVTLNIYKNEVIVHERKTEPWEITLVDTGENSMTGGRLKRVKKYLNNDTFLFTYGDGLADISIKDLIKHHKDQKKLATISAVQPPGRYGSLKIDEEYKVYGFQEKPLGDGGWINGGFFALEPQVIDQIEGDSTIWEEAPLNQIAQDGQLNAYFHRGFWRPMDTLRDKMYLNDLWDKSKAPWRIW